MKKSRCFGAVLAILVMVVFPSFSNATAAEKVNQGIEDGTPS